MLAAAEFAGKRIEDMRRRRRAAASHARLMNQTRLIITGLSEISIP